MAWKQLYQITLNEDEFKSLIEMIEQHRCEGEEELCSSIRTSVKSQFNEQEEDRPIQIDDILESTKKTLGPGYCDNCD